MKRIILILFSLNIYSGAFAQLQNSNWYFGNNAGLSFNGAVSELYNGQISMDEGSSVISDASGNLLFYSDGMTVYDKTHNPMSNGSGLLGGPSGSSAQSCIIIKQPGSTNLYYLFTVAEAGGPNGLRYNIIDMNANLGNGAVILKNVLLHASTSEKIAATYHCNGVDLWVMTHDMSSTNFRAYLLSSTGLSAPVITAIGPSINLDPDPSNDDITGIGSIKFSPTGGVLAMTNADFNPYLGIFSFNQSTGVVSNEQSLNIATANGGDPANTMYGIEFSPNNTFLYVTSSKELMQYDVSSGIAATIDGTRVLINTLGGGFYGQLQLAPDGKIYCAKTRSTHLGVISTPNILEDPMGSGTTCSYFDAGQLIDPYLDGSWAISFGLPSLLTYIPAAFNYNATNTFAQCTGVPAPLFVAPQFGQTGTFTSSPAGLSIDPTTGVIELSTSVVGTYQITFALNDVPGCTSPYQHQINLEIVPTIPLCYTKRASQWYMGKRIGLNFLCSSPPAVMDDSQAQTGFNDTEGTCSIADDNGNLLFYAFGNKVFNRNHVAMPNCTGILGHFSMSQGYLPVPNPSNPNKYYLFHIGFGGGTQNLYYSEIDLTLNAGLGDIVEATKSTLLLANVGEQLTAVETCASNEYWVAARSVNDIYCYKVTSTGISAPVISSSPVPIDQGVSGSMVFSPTGRNIAISYNNYAPLNVFTFDKESGKACWKETLTEGGYGLSFSNNGKYLYANDNFLGIHQYDVEAVNIYSTKVQLHNPSVTNEYIYGTMHLGPDCKLYVFGLNKTVGTVINFPNNPGLACGLVFNSFPTSWDPTQFSTRYGNINYVQSWFKDPTYVEPVLDADFTATTSCTPSSAQFTNTTNNLSNCPNYARDFGDPTSGVNNTSTLEDPSHIFSAPGNYTVTLTISERCQTSTEIIPIDVCSITLPIELLSFSGKPKDKYSEITWQTATEINNDYFTLEKSDGGINWREINRTKGAGNSTQILNYSYNDYEILSEVMYYRLKQTDYNGEFKYSNIITLAHKKGIESEIFPNPSSGLFTIISDEEITSIKIFDSLGKILFENTNKIIDLSEFENGLYSVVIISDNKITVKKIVKM